MEKRNRGSTAKKRKQKCCTKKKLSALEGKVHSESTKAKGPDAKRRQRKIAKSQSNNNNTAYAKACFFVATGFFVIWAKVIYLEYQVP
jgi:hypothetical protein